MCRTAANIEGTTSIHTSTAGTDKKDNKLHPTHITTHNIVPQKLVTTGNKIKNSSGLLS
jgi:hypothetical protein